MAGHEVSVAAAFYYWGAVGYHRLSAFGQFPYPSGPVQSERAGTSPPSCFVPRHRAENHVDVSLGDAWRARASERTFRDTALSLDALAGLLWSGYGFSRGDGGRAVPSAGSTYALRLQVVALRVDGLRSGVHDVVLTEQGVGWAHHRDITLERLTACFVTQHVDYSAAAAVVVVVGQLARAALDYGERAYRMLHLEAGHVGQNISLVAAAHGIEHVCVAGFDDEVAESALGIDAPAELLVYGMALGGGGRR